MKFLMLRGKVPTDRDYKEIIFDKLEDCDDVWTQLFYKLLTDEDYGEVLYWGKSRFHRYKENFVERWVYSFKNYTPSFIPDIIWARGGFTEYHFILEKFPNSFKIYYGAGIRFLPQPGFSDYDLILQDSEARRKISQETFKNSYSTMFVKPAADNIFYPINVNKKYDICFPANRSQSFKGHDFVYNTVPKHLTILNLGNNPRKEPVPENVFSIRVLRNQMRYYISRCKVGIVTSNTNRDSCPRVLPEMLACNIPIVVLKGTHFWEEKYINDSWKIGLPTGLISDKQNFWKSVESVLNNLSTYKPREYYEKFLSLETSANFLRKLINRELFLKG